MELRQSPGLDPAAVASGRISIHDLTTRRTHASAAGRAVVRVVIERSWF
jgi:hypothetical protein